MTGITLFAFSIYTGDSLFFDKNKKKGIVLTIINQSFQLLKWNILGYGISYSSGAELLIGIKGGAMNFRISGEKLAIAMKSAFNRYRFCKNQYVIKYSRAINNDCGI